MALAPVGGGAPAAAFAFLLALGGRPASGETVAEARVLVLGATDPYHSPMVDASGPLLEGIARATGVGIEVTRDPAVLADENLARYAAVVQLHMAPFDLSSEQQQALQSFVSQGKGWVGVHAAGLTGAQFVKDGRPYWTWFEEFLGGVVYSPHPALQEGVLVLEDRSHPVTRNLPARLRIRDEWYEFDRSPRPAVHVLACADESSYHQNKPMGDHPLVWTNPRYRRMVYIGVGHDVSMCSDPNFTILLRDAIAWAASPETR